MLVDLPHHWSPPVGGIGRMLSALEAHGHVDGPYRPPVRVHRGIYAAHVNFDHEIEDLIRENYPEWKQRVNWFNCYGTCDHWTQILQEYRSQLEHDERHFMIYLSQPIRKSDQPATGGWRWHKWGPYIGVFQTQVEEHEYLYDTPDVVEVFAYHVVEVNY